MKMANMRFALCALLCFAVADSAQEEDPGTIAGDDAYPAQTCDEWASFTDSPAKTQVWRAMSSYSKTYIEQLLHRQPCAAKARTADGRGPLFWANEQGMVKVRDLLIQLGADPKAKDKSGMYPEGLFVEEADEDYYDEEDYEEYEYDEESHEDYNEEEYEAEEEDDYEDEEEEYEDKTELR